MHILSVGSYYQECQQDALDDLSALAKQHARQRYRRIDRFIQLALIGSARCTNNQPINSQDGLIICSGLAAMANTVAVQEQIIKNGEPPKPARFINTLSNSAGFYVASNLGLTGRNLFVSRGEQSLFAGLSLAQQELLLRPQRQLLLGALDECLSPLAQHRQRLQQTHEQTLGEGSHWFLLSNEKTQKTLASIEAPRLFHNEASLIDAIARDENSDYLFYSSNASIPAGLSCFEKKLGYYHSRDAGVIADFIHERAATGLLVVNRDRWQRFHYTRLTLA